MAGNHIAHRPYKMLSQSGRWPMKPTKNLSATHKKSICWLILPTLLLQFAFGVRRLGARFEGAPVRKRKSDVIIRIGVYVNFCPVVGFGALNVLQNRSTVLWCHFASCLSSYHDGNRNRRFDPETARCNCVVHDSRSWAQLWRRRQLQVCPNLVTSPE